MNEPRDAFGDQQQDRPQEAAASAPEHPSLSPETGLLFGSVPGVPVPSYPPGALADAVRAALAPRIGSGESAAELCGSTEKDWELVSHGRLDEAELVRLYSRVTGIPVGDEEELRELEAFPEVTFDFVAQHTALPLAWDARHVVLAVAEPYSLGRLAYLWTAIFQQKPSFLLHRRAAIERYLTALYDAGAAQEQGLNWDGDTSEQALRDLAREAPIVRLVSDMFSRAQEMGASDIHVEPSEDSLAIRFRVDGILSTVLNPPVNQYAAIASRLKLLAGMNIAERRLPQDGRIDLAGPNPLDIRVSTVPGMHGESIVLRLLQKDVTTFDLDKVGLSPAMKGDLERLFTMPHGMILVVGPTGSGKTTTLYCIMRKLNSEERKIITIEEPVEYQLEGLTQIHVRPQIGLTFANGLRSIVRQDPDVILVGEIRDRETAEIAIHAALTGHLVLSTLHTNDAPGAISRLLEMGVEGFLISSALLGVLSQRLVRRVCPDCGGSGRAGAGDAAEETGGGRRCRNCLGSGYRGRIGIFEMLPVTDEVRRAVNERRDSTEIAAIGRRHGMRSLREDGEGKVRQGITSAAEVARVCQFDALV
ncbi:MAG: type II/IV secretion system protein [Lentisphaeria bacterium]|nr:type II/IV secretion system protein [Lentisphaeria bacterium]